jgi:hypothetical protein
MFVFLGPFGRSQLRRQRPKGQWNTPFVSAMWHAFSVQFRGDAHPGLRHGRNPGLVCGTSSACLADADINGSYMS